MLLENAKKNNVTESYAICQFEQLQVRLSKNLEALATMEDLLKKKDEEIILLTSELVMLNSNLEVKLISFLIFYLFDYFESIEKLN